MVRTTRVLLTGFEPFVEGIPTNPSWDIIAPLEGRVLALDGREALVRAVRLPVAYGRAADALERGLWVDAPRDTTDPSVRAAFHRTLCYRR